jgi:hypothetical protein
MEMMFLRKWCVPFLQKIKSFKTNRDNNCIFATSKVKEMGEERFNSEKVKKMRNWSARLKAFTKNWKEHRNGRWKVDLIQMPIQD